MYGFLLLLAVVIFVRKVGRRLMPLVMPPSRLKTLGVGLLGGYLGSILFRWIHVGDWAIIAGTHMLGALAGALVFVLILGLLPFLRILLGKVEGG